MRGGGPNCTDATVIMSKGSIVSFSSLADHTIRLIYSADFEEKLELYSDALVADTCLIGGLRIVRSSTPVLSGGDRDWIGGRRVLHIMEEFFL